MECGSAVARREREGELKADEAAEAHARLHALSTTWNEINPSQALRTAAIRMVRVHPLRAAGALQLVAGMIASEYDPTSLQFLTLDERLRTAAQKEGFRLFSL